MIRLSRSAFTLIELLIVLAVVSILLGLVMSALWAVRDAADRVSCCNNLRQIAIAYKAHADQFETYPTPVSNTKYGIRLRSSIPPLLPYLGCKEVYVLWNPKADWNDPVNAPFLNHAINLLLCPSVPKTPALIDAGSPNQNCKYPHYRSDYGELTNIDSRVWPLVDPANDYTGLLNHNNLSGFTRADTCSDGLSNTILIAEDAGRPPSLRLRRLQTRQPGQRRRLGQQRALLRLRQRHAQDAGLDRPCHERQRGLLVPPAAGADLAFGDGSILRFALNNIEGRVLAAMVTARGGEVFTMPW